MEYIDDNDFEGSDIDFGDENSNGDFDPIENVVMIDVVKDNNIPNIYDYEWTDYVLADLHDNEMYNGNPTVDGLRRLVRKFIGEIVRNHTYICPHSHDKYAVAIVTIAVNTHARAEISCTGSADVIPESVDHPFDKHLVAMAETRAEGRALRKILQLRKVITAEELAPDTKIVVEESSDAITNNQINFIDIMSRNDSRGLNINVVKLINSLTNHTNIKELSHADGIMITNTLSTYQQKTDSIPNELIGYQSSWKNEV